MPLKAISNLFLLQSYCNPALSTAGRCWYCVYTTVPGNLQYPDQKEWRMFFSYFLNGLSEQGQNHKKPDEHLHGLQPHAGASRYALHVRDIFSCLGSNKKSSFNIKIMENREITGPDNQWFLFENHQYPRLCRQSMNLGYLLFS